MARTALVLVAALVWSCGNSKTCEGQSCDAGPGAMRTHNGPAAVANESADALAATGDSVSTLGRSIGTMPPAAM